MALYSTTPTPNIDPTPSTVGTVNTVVVKATAVLVLAANAARKGFTFYNNSSRILYLGLADTVTATAGFFAIVPANSLYEWSQQSVFTGAIFAIANGANANCQVFEITP